MKTMLSVAVFIAMMATPVLAEKTLVNPKPTCADSAVTYKMIVYHLDQIEMLIDEMKQNISMTEQKPKHIFKKSS
jgi:hypothetical protein